ncbi:quinoprotein dehydrogenase-associated SoxYZ-like carrier [Paracoccus sp. S1E-3]|uniref:quinoprotein dehydrogenase-associated SoxYZ-like carrier n=1 Tax=Paracoccus sp. S1E-3 TaxID=2756130 RepID=UPI0015EF5FD2|nr:quinoprotein dehydrogenase-associated SoxYZ-like carrier [Paracoccus sp. S1E-3]MBA4491120.1 quinoprotein dehydrogenase-associated SoxYZ-like carrier [Paracoccus sp. S1E-3]
MRLLFVAAVLMLSGLAAAAQDNPMQPSETWEALRYDVIEQDTDPADAAGVMVLDAPARATNPALVPVRITQPEGAPAIRRLIVVVDQNPSPVVATFTFGERMMPLDFEIRVRVDAYSNLRAIAYLDDGRSVMAGRFVKASGGCAAPAGSGPDALADAGEMRLKTIDEAGRQISTLMIRHPNFSGFQRDQVTLLNIPARFIDTVEVTQDGESLFTMEGGISISENPVFRFAHQPSLAPLTVHATDIDGAVFDQVLSVGATG